MTLTQKQILLVDDDALMTELFSEILSERYDVRTANSITEAQAIIECENIHLVISDYHIGRQNAGELFVWVMGVKPTLAARFMVLTGDKMADLTVFKSLVLYKPVQIDSLLAAVKQLLTVEMEAS